MKLDDRIKSLSDILTCFDVEKAKDFIGQKGYFAGDLYCFSDVEQLCPYAALVNVFDQEDAFYRGDITFPFFIPECFLKPKKYRAFTLSEFTEKFPVGQPIKFRSKGDVVRELYLILLGYRLALSKDQTVPYISIGHFTYLLDELFDHYEWWDPATGGWALFGVEE